MEVKKLMIARIADETILKGAVKLTPTVVIECYKALNPTAQNQKSFERKLFLKERPKKYNRLLKF